MVDTSVGDKTTFGTDLSIEAGRREIMYLENKKGLRIFLKNPEKLYFVKLTKYHQHTYLRFIKLFAPLKHENVLHV